MNLPKLLKQAEKLTSNGKLNEAIEIYQEILSEEFQDLHVHNLIAQLYVEKGDMQRASRHFFKIAAESSSQGNISDATAAYRQIIKILPKNILAREKLLEVFTRAGAKNELMGMMTELCSISEAEGNFQKTIEYLEKLIALETGNKAHAMKLALFLNERGFKDKAIDVLYQLARELYDEDRYEDSLATLEKVRAIDSKHKLLAARMSEVYERQGKIERAIEVLSSSIADDSQPIIVEHLANLYVKAGRVEEAERAYEKIIKLDRSFLPKIVPFIEVLLADRKIDRAISYIDRLHNEVQDSDTRRKCVELLEEILKLDPQKLDVYRLLEAFYGASFQYDQLAITLLSHADTYITKCEYGKALDVARQLVDLEPYNEDYRKKYELIEKLLSGGSQKVSGKPTAVQPDDDDDGQYVAAKVDAHFDSTVSIVTDEDVENFIIDIELLEKFGQHSSAIGRLEHVIKQYPQEVKLRQKLKSLYFDRKLPKRAAKECLEIAKVLQQQGLKEEASRYLREAQRLNPLLSSAKRDVTDAAAPQKSEPTSVRTNDHVALRGDLSEIGLLDVIQVLENCQKNGKLLLTSEGRTGAISFNAGRMVDATFQDKSGEQAVYALIALKGGSFDYQPSNTAFNVVIRNTNTNLLLEGLRLLDEANRDMGDPESIPAPPQVPLHAKANEVPTQNATRTPESTAPVMATRPIGSFVEEEFPLEEI